MIYKKLNNNIIKKDKQKIARKCLFETKFKKIYIYNIRYYILALCFYYKKSS